VIVSFLFSNRPGPFWLGLFAKETRKLCLFPQSMATDFISQKHMRNSHFSIFVFSFFVSPLLGSFLFGGGVCCRWIISSASPCATKYTCPCRCKHTHKRKHTHIHAHTGVIAYRNPPPQLTHVNDIYIKSERSCYI